MRMDDDAALDLENRRRIFQFVSGFQGAHLREVQRAVGLEIGVLDYHLDYLVKNGLLTSRKEMGRKRYFTKALSPGDKALLAVLRQGVLRRLLMHILLNPGCTFRELHALSGTSKSTLSFHLKRLRGTGLVVRIDEGGRKGERYSAVKGEDIAKLLITYKSTFLDDAVDRFVEVWQQL